MRCHVKSQWHLHQANRSRSDVLCVQDDQVGDLAPLVSRNTHQVAIALGCLFAPGNEARLMDHDGVTALPHLRHASASVHVHYTVPQAAAPDDAPSVPVGLADIPVVDAGHLTIDVAEDLWQIKFIRFCFGIDGESNKLPNHPIGIRGPELRVSVYERR